MRIISRTQLSKAATAALLSSGGGDAIHLLRLYEYAAAVIDWRMPEMTGIDVIQAVRPERVRT